MILTCSPSGHSEERDEWGEMIPRELDLSVLVAATPPGTHLWHPTDAEERVKKNALSAAFLLRLNEILQLWSKNEQKQLLSFCLPIAILGS